MPDYQALSDPSQIHSKSNPYITKHYRKDKPLIKKRSRRNRGDRGPDSPLIRDLLILRDGMETIMGYDQLSGQEYETAESTLDPDVSELTPTDITSEVPKDTDEPVRRENTSPPSDPTGEDTLAHRQRGQRRETQYSPEEIELLRRAMLLINKGN
mgnify:CR=1 FL=1